MSSLILEHMEDSVCCNLISARKAKTIQLLSLTLAREVSEGADGPEFQIMNHCHNVCAR